MRSSSTWVAALVLLSSASPVLAQKIAPSRQFGAAVDSYSGLSDAPTRTYAPAPRTSAPDKNYGMPTFGNPEANMPRQRATVAPKPQTEEVAPGVQRAMPMPDLSVAPTDDTDPVADAFTRDRPAEPLPSELARGTGAGETSLFTTSEGSIAGRPGRVAGAAGRGPAPTQPDPLFTTGAATTTAALGAASAARTAPTPGDGSALETGRAPNPLAVGR
jgi:hypothetical protein